MGHNIIYISLFIPFSLVFYQEVVAQTVSVSDANSPYVNEYRLFNRTERKFGSKSPSIVINDYIYNSDERTIETSDSSTRLKEGESEEIIMMYDNAGQLVQLTSTRRSKFMKIFTTTDHTIDFSYNRAGLLTQYQFSGANSGSHFIYRDGLLERIDRVSDGETRCEFTYDESGHRVKSANKVVTVEYFYEGGRLSSLSAKYTKYEKYDVSIGYDSNDNIQIATYSRSGEPFREIKYEYEPTDEPVFNYGKLLLDMRCNPFPIGISTIDQ